MQHSSTPWWMTDSYIVSGIPPETIGQHAGPKGMALVRAWPDGRTDQGWGLNGPKSDPENGFMPRYNRGEFNERRVLYGYNRGKWAFAFIMRSLSLVCVDIDGKNGGLTHAKRLGPLPPTLAETSKSGNGYHLFYTVEDEWDERKGFALLSDRIGIEQGVDFRATGCVYHHEQQRWNQREPAPLPQHLLELLQQRQQQQQATHARIQTVLANDDPMEVLMMHDELVSDLAKPIPAGKRNNTLFAIGNKMREAGVEGWDVKVGVRATQVGLDSDEVTKLVENIERYGANA